MEIDYGPYKFQEYEIPGYMMGGLERYIENGVPPGRFLRNVLEGDLFGALRHADHNNMANLPAYGAFLYNRAPAGCFGTKKAVSEWVKNHGLNGIRKNAEETT